LKTLLIIYTCLFLSLITISNLEAQDSKKIAAQYEDRLNQKGEVIETIIYHKNGKVKYIIPFKNNVIHGTLKTFNKKGVLKSENNYFDETLDGKQYYYYKKSMVIETASAGKRDKIFHVVYFFKDGSLKEEYNNKFFEGFGPYVKYYKNGNIKIEGSYEGIRRDGIWKFYNQDGTLRKSKKYSNKFVFSFRQCVF
jgi:antitoxin component YwqK of YwqJK toxin-antitoxin module